jgi:hypothetical protein
MAHTASAWAHSTRSSTGTCSSIVCAMLGPPGLIEQLKYEGFSKKDATYAADAVGANWKQEAVESAEGYLDLSGFSRSGLIEQLEYEGFTPAQARYAANKVGL